ncbi:major facilitator superfamily domain-containing protein [Hypoxylon rubiginosum]|uniref:Major facilitator superfamily domain-containing protein n=1 Tax=Hypoxylon rubiginosum TaxID=110542 RepID=A0ACB9YMH6_9PEZI|nr:major facilitator superfamily domain-containing protein [Hypoxylon rubiginosum]
MADLSKACVGILNSGSRPGSAISHSSPVDHATVLPPINESKLVRKIDFRVLPILFIVYVVSFLDRVNMSNALTLGLPEELGLTGQQPNVALAIFFIPFIIFEIPSNLLLKRFRPRVWLSICVLTFGVVTIGQGFVQSHSSLLVTRFLLGLAESGIFPGSFYLISFWYKREEAQKRFTAYYSSTIVAGAFGGLLCSAIANLNGVRGLTSWRWVFILEGIVTVLAKWLSESERQFLLKKTESNESHTVPVTSKDMVTFLSRATNWLGALMYFSLSVPGFSVVYFVPSIVQGWGYNTLQTQLHSVPPFAAALGFTLVSAYLSDRLRLHSPFIFLALALLITGLAILLTIHGTKTFSVEYAAICLTAMGSIGIGGHVVCWYVMNLQGHVERSLGSAWMICFGGIAGLVATFAFMKKEAPYYLTGYSLSLATASLCVVVHLCYGLLIWRDKRAMARNGGGNPGRTLYL